MEPLSSYFPLDGNVRTDLKIGIFLLRLVLNSSPRYPRNDVETEVSVDKHVGYTRFLRACPCSTDPWRHLCGIWRPTRGLMGLFHQHHTRGTLRACAPPPHTWIPAINTNTDNICYMPGTDQVLHVRQIDLEIQFLPMRTLKDRC